MRTTLATILFGVLVLAAPRVARAHEEGGTGRTVDHRGDDDGSSSSSSSASTSTSSSSSSASSSDDTPTWSANDGSSDTAPSGDVESSTPACVEGACPGPPTWTFELGTLVRNFRAPDVRAQSGDSSLADSREVGGLMRLTFTATEHLYLGTEVRIGDVTPTPAVGDGRMGSSLVDLGLAGVIGARSRAGHFELDGEVVGGVREYAVPSGTDPSGTGATEAAAIVEARLRGVVWIGSRWFVSGEVAASPLDTRDLGGVISLGFTSRSFAAPEPPLPTPAGA